MSDRFSLILKNKAIVFVVFVLLLLIVNDIVIWFFASQQKTSKDNLVLQQISGVCPQSCLTKFSQNNTTSISATISPTSIDTIATPTETPTPTTSPTPIPTPTPTPTLREYFIPLGQGNGSNTDWKVVPGMGVKINITSYGEIEKVYFEATVRINGSQTVYIRLYNANSLQSITNSDLTSSNGTATLLTSQPISLTDTKDENLYQVQLKTQLGGTTYIDQARLRILARE